MMRVPVGGVRDWQSMITMENSMENTMKRTIWINDGAYLFRSGPGRFDYLKLKHELENGARATFTESYYFSAQSSPTAAQDSFNKWLKCAPPIGPKMILKLYSLKSMHSRCPHCSAEYEKYTQKGVDVGIVTLMLQLAEQDRYDQLVLTSGDGDFADAVEYIKRMGKSFCLAGFKDSVSPDLQCFADSMLWLDDLWDKVRRVPIGGEDELASSGFGKDICS